MAGSEPETVFTFEAQPEHIDASNPVQINLQELRARRVKDGNHLWVVALLFYIPDPEVALDDMFLGAHNIIGSQPFTCLWCQVPYQTPSDPGPQCQS